MKKNEKGFTLLETLIVTTVVVGTLIYLFTQINNVKTNYDISFKYNTIPGLYSGKNIVDYLKESGYSTLISVLNSNSNDFIEIEDNSLIDGGDEEYFDTLKKATNISKILFVKDDITSLKEKLEDCYDSDTTNNTAICNEKTQLKNFIRNLNTDAFPDTYRLIIQKNDGTFVSLEIGWWNEK